MNPPHDNYAAVAVLPPVSGGRLQDASLRAWLSRSDLRLEPERRDLLSQVTRTMGLPTPHGGFAALRMWGQTGQRPDTWLAAADPVHLEPRLDSLCLHALRESDTSTDELGALFEHLQSTLADDRNTTFERLATCGYLRTDEVLTTPFVPASVVDQQSPGEYLPEGASAARYRNLLSEIEMSLHDCDVNQRRVGAGQMPINSLWLWGGGYAPECEAREQPPLFADDPLLAGYWASAGSPARRWPGSIEKCIETEGAAFVAVTPDTGNDAAMLQDSLRQLKRAVLSKAIRRLKIIFRDGRCADIRRWHELRFWRRESRLLV